MMMRICLALVFASLAFPALAEKKCLALDRTKFDKGTTFTVLTPGQIHFVQGAYTAIPPIGPPPGDGAMLIRHGEQKAFIAFTSKKLVCDIMLTGPAFTEILLKIGTGPLDADGEEL